MKFTPFTEKSIQQFTKIDKKKIKGVEPFSRTKQLGGSLAEMIGFIYEGQVSYITKIEDFREFMEPWVYDAMISAFNAGIIDNYRDKYEELREEHIELQEDYDSLQNEKDEETSFLEEQVDKLTDKAEALLKNIKKLVDEQYQGYLKPEDVVYELEKLI